MNNKVTESQYKLIQSGIVKQKADIYGKLRIPLVLEFVHYKCL